MAQSPPQSPDPDLSSTSKLSKWRLVDSRPGPSLRICKVRYDKLENPRNGLVLEATVLETPAWVNIVALTDERELVCVRQYRFGAGAVTLEIPGGLVDPGEEHRAAAERELAEETGYRAKSWRYLGCVQPNPAFHTNLCHHWLAEGAYLHAVQELDDGEDIEVLTLEASAVRQAVESGELQHALAQTALARVFDLRIEGFQGNLQDAEGRT